MSKARAAPFLVSSLRSEAHAVREAGRRALARADDRAAVHDLRVAICRLRVLLSAARVVFGRARVDAVRVPLTAIFRATSVVRDAEVLRETLAAAGADEADEWVAARAAEADGARRALVARLAAGELDRALDRIDALVAQPAEPRRDLSPRALARRRVRRARRRVARRARVSTDDAPGLHALRIAAKKLRYAAELFAQVLGPRAVRRGARAARLQKRLGAVHDLDVALAKIRGAPRGAGRREAIARYLEDAAR